jgi:hypothetical protein
MNVQIINHHLGRDADCCRNRGSGANPSQSGNGSNQTAIPRCRSAVAIGGGHDADMPKSTRVTQNFQSPLRQVWSHSTRSAPGFTGS